MSTVQEGRGEAWGRPPALMPGLGLSLGVTLALLSGVVLIPLAALVLRAAELGPAGLYQTLSAPRVLSAVALSFGAAGAAALVNAIFGLIVAWVLVRYRFPGRRLLDALVDLPFALPTAVAGIALTALYTKHGWLGRPLGEHLGLEVAFTRAGVVVALIFIGHPFVVRTLQPVIAELDPEVEEAALSLGAPPWQIFRRVHLPEVLPALVEGSILAFARGVGEFGSVVFISGNMPGRTEIAPLMVVSKLEQHDEAGAAAIGTLLLLVSLGTILAMNLLERRRRRLAGDDR